MEPAQKERKKAAVKEGVDACTAYLKNIPLSPEKKNALWKECVVDWIALAPEKRLEIQAQCQSQSGDPTVAKTCMGFKALNPEIPLSILLQRDITELASCEAGKLQAPDLATKQEFAEWCLAQVQPSIIPSRSASSLSDEETPSQKGRSQRVNEDILQMLLSGKFTAHKIARKVGVPLSVVKEYRTQLGLLPHRGRGGAHTDILREILTEYHLQGVPDMDIAKKLGVSPVYITQLRKRLGVFNVEYDDEARSTATGVVFRSPDTMVGDPIIVHGATFMLPVPFHSVKRQNYCSAAAIQMVLDYFGVRPLPDQDDLHSFCEYFEVCDPQPLSQYGVQARKLHLESVDPLISELERGSPIILRIMNPRTHSVVVIGARTLAIPDGNPEILEFIYHDPAKSAGFLMISKETLVDEWRLTQQYSMVFERIASIVQESFSPDTTQGLSIDDMASSRGQKKRIIVDTSFLINYYFIGKLEFLCEVFEQLIIPPAVWQECLFESRTKWSTAYPQQTLIDILSTLKCRHIMAQEELTRPEKKLIQTLFQSLTGLKKKSLVHRGEMEALAILLLRDDIDFLISDNHAPFTLREIAERQLPLHPFLERYPHLRSKLSEIQVDMGLYPMDEAVELEIINSLSDLDQHFATFYRKGRPIYNEEDILRSQHRLKEKLIERERMQKKKEKEGEKERLKFKDATIEQKELEWHKGFEEIRKERWVHAEESMKKAREVRIKSFQERWEVIKQRCTKKEIEGIKHFVYEGSYSESAALAGMSILEFMAMLEELELARCQ